MAISIAEQLKAKLEQGWETCPDKDINPRPRYAALVATVLIEFVGFTEKMLRALAGRLGAIEAQQAEILKNLKMEPVAVEPIVGANGNGHTNGNGHAEEAPAAPAAPKDVRGMVRLDAMDRPMSPDEQANEEKMDMATLGKIDESRYAPRSQVQG